jgi:hypothetical protein
MLARYFAAVLALAAAAGCSRIEPPSPPAARSAALWRVECRPVKDTWHQACYGPGWDENQPHDPARFQFYQVSIERRQASEASQVLFVKRLAIGEVDPRRLGEPAPQSLAAYDAATRTVRFDLGATPLVVPLEDAR